MRDAFARAMGKCISLNGYKEQGVTNLVACPHCNLIHQFVALHRGQSAACQRCGTRLHDTHAEKLDFPLAFALAGAVVFVLMWFFPLLSLSLQGPVVDTTLPGAVGALYRQGLWALTILVAWAALIAPGLMIATKLYVLFPMRQNRVPVGFVWVMRGIRHLQMWSMVEVFMLGVLVSLVKLDKVGEAHAAIGTWLCVALMLLVTSLENMFDSRCLWARYARLQAAQAGGTAPCAVQGRETRAAKLCVCKECGLICHEHVAECPRCHSTLHAAHRNSQSRCLALLLASLVLYFPANLLTMMETTSAFDVQNDTIISGVVYLWRNGSPDLAIIVFVASVVVPLLKILVLGMLLACVKWRWPIPPHQQGRLYRLIEVIGKWSMLDLFVLALLCALVDFGPLASVRVGPAANAFGAVVVLTMLAASAFDPHLIWQDSSGIESTHHD